MQRSLLLNALACICSKARLGGWGRCGLLADYLLRPLRRRQEALQVFMTPRMRLLRPNFQLPTTTTSRAASTRSVQLVDNISLLTYQCTNVKFYCVEFDNVLADWYQRKGSTETYIGYTYDEAGNNTKDAHTDDVWRQIHEETIT
ncbi:hypothetical protein DFJ58DRAFT_915191 [Suillus subalutaceus]|uniref:uncharacterized protein n=1 Tax=Suillus subalutaceus TaxID=48586 RepID=UPI001B880DE4|nr:uncharacterized protein DFJ58DRAFT_915191 [Suillus subalutaceus]KAG1847514.1 hypothetical protein DFJ58DRAFT_915191 [Suillus subalutaceus]